jgi:hypothetical protein
MYQYWRTKVHRPSFCIDRIIKHITYAFFYIFIFSDAYAWSFDIAQVPRGMDHHFYYFLKEALAGISHHFLGGKYGEVDLVCKKRLVIGGDSSLA